MLMAQVPTVDELINDLMELRRGHGVLADDAPRRASTAVKGVCGIHGGDSEAVVRHKLVDRLTELTLELPEQYRAAVGAALALAPHSQERFLHQRMKWAATQMDRDHQRTANRRLQPGFRLLAEKLLLRWEAGDAPELDWYTVELDAVLRMDLDPPVLCETRTIRAIVDDLDEVTAQLTLPPYPSPEPPATVRARVVFGGEIVEKSVQTRTYAAFLVRFAEPLMSGDRHQYSVEFTGPRRSAFNPMYVMEPLRRCDRFDVRVKFSPDSQPHCIWRIDGLPPRRVDEHLPTPDPVRLDSVGEAFASFSGLVPGLSYGLQWDP